MILYGLPARRQDPARRAYAAALAFLASKHHDAAEAKAREAQAFAPRWGAPAEMLEWIREARLRAEGPPEAMLRPRLAVVRASTPPEPTPEAPAEKTLPGLTAWLERRR